MKPPLIHIGYHKTGSSLLQRQVFSNKETGFYQPEKKSALLNTAFILRDPGSPPEPEALSQLKQHHQAAHNDSLVLALSHERLSGYPASGGYDQIEIAQRLHEAFPEGKVLIIIREQCAVLLSMYLQSVSDGSSLSLGQFLAPPEPHIRRQPLFRRSFYCYDVLIRRYQELFGTENVKVLPYELLRFDLGRFASELQDFTGANCSEDIDLVDILRTPMNPALPLAFQLMRRQANKLFRTQLSNSGPIKISSTSVHSAVKKMRNAISPLSVFDRSLKQRYRSQILEATKGEYIESNNLTSELIGIDLSNLGYAT